MTTSEDKNIIILPLFIAPLSRIFGTTCKATSFLFLFFVSTFFLLSLSTVPLKAQPVTQESFELKLSSLEQQYDNQVLSILTNYFDRRKFFIDVHVEAQIVDETYRTTQNQVVQGPTHNVMMPGLPYLPEENLQPQQQIGNDQTQTVVNESTIRRLQILQLEVNVYADTSFTPQQVEFMELLAGIAAKINETRGDIVNVYQVGMPEMDMSGPPQVIQLSQSESDTLMGSIRDYIPGLLLMLLIGLTLVISKFSNGRTQQEVSMRQKRDQFKNEQYYEPALAPEKKAEPKTEKEKPSTSRSDFDEITRQFLLNSKEVALLFESWMAENPKEGAQKAAHVVHSIDKHIVKALKGNLQPEMYGAIADKVYSMEELPYEEKRKVAADFIKELEAMNDPEVSSKKPHQLTLFQFLDHVAVHQIIQLLAGEDKTTSALVIDYLPEEKASKVLNRLNKNQNTEIMLGTSEINDLSFQDHKKISSRLFSKMMDILETEKEMQQGLDNVLRVLEKLPLEEQQQYIEQLKATGSPVADLVDKQFITLDEIPNISSRLIKEALDPVPTETLLNALAGMDDPIVEHILSVRPKREQRLLKMELKTGESVQDDQMKQAKARIMSYIRNAVNKSKDLSG